MMPVRCGAGRIVEAVVGTNVGAFSRLVLGRRAAAPKPQTGARAASRPRAAQAADLGDPSFGWAPAGPIGAVTDSAGNPADTGRFFPRVLTVRGNSYAVWLDSRVDDLYGERNPEVMLRVSPDDGRTWGPLRNISAAPVVGDDWGPPALAANDSSVLVAFATITADAGGTHYPDVTSLVRVTGVAGGTVDRRRVPGHLYNLAVAGAGNSYHLVGHEAPSGRLVVSRSTDDGATFSQPRPIYTPCRAYVGDIADVIDVAAAGNQVVIAFLDPCSGEHGDVWATISNDAGANWSPASRISDALLPEYPPSVHLANGVATIAWQSVRSERGRTLDVATSTDGGATWTSPATIETHETDPSDSGLDYCGPWTSPKFSGTGDALMLYPPLSPNVLASTDHGLTWHVAGNAPNGGQGVAYVNRGDRSLFAWKAQDTQSWIGSVGTGRPAPPSGVTAELTGPQTAKVTWRPSVSQGVEKYTVYDQTGRSVASRLAAETSATITDLGWGIAYAFTVTAENAAGASDLSGPSNTVTPTGAPSRPAKPVATVKGHTVTVDWPPVDPHGSPVTSYRVESSTGATRTTAGTVTRSVFRRLPPGRHKFRVTAVNAVGSSPASAWVRVRVDR